MNVLTVTGRLSVDPVRRDTASGVVCEFRLAVDGRPRLWLPVTCWGHLAGVCSQHLHNGRRVAVSGQLRCDEYVSVGGDKQRRWHVKAEHVTFLDSPNSVPTPVERPAEPPRMCDNGRPERTTTFAGDPDVG